jgi:MSHA biogenesis protein MshI
MGLGRTRGWWGLASGPDATVAAHLNCDAEGALELTRLEILSGAGDQPARRSADVARVLGTRRAPCAMLMPVADYHLHFMPGLPVPPQERGDALRWRLKDDLDFPAAEAVIDCVAAPVQNQSMEHGLWMAVVTRRKRAFELIAPLTRAGAAIRALDVTELAQRNLAAAMAPAGRTVSMLSLDRRNALLTVSRDDGMFAARHFDPLAVALHEAQNDPARRAELIERLALELQRTFDNVERQYATGQIDRLVVLAEPRSSDLVDGLQAALAANVTTLELDRVCSARDAALLQRAAESRTACLAIGAAVRARAEAVT